jgi:Fic family protein
VEVQILLAAHLPAPVCHLLSNHYNQTRSEYYRQLDLAGQTGDPIPFINYAVQGLVDGISDALQTIRAQQFEDRWEQYVYETVGEIKSEADRRRLKLALAISENYRESLEPTKKSEMRRLNTDLSELYAGKTVKTLTRDINAIGELGLIEKEGNGYIPRDWILLTFQPQRRHGDAD